MTNDRFSIPDLRSRIVVGCQGWNYEDWISKPGGETVFYPRGTRPAGMLPIYAQVFESVEVDSTFYAIPAASVVENWYQKTPAGFTFSLKLPREITHERVLQASSFPILDEFCGRIMELKEKLAVVLVQLPPQFEASKENALKLRQFLARLPREIQFAVEFREREWIVDWTLEELERNSVALCLVEGSWIPRAVFFDTIDKSGVDFAYVRFMGERDLTRFDRIYRHEDVNLAVWKAELERLKARRTFVYFSNFYEGHAPASGFKLQQLFGQPTFQVSRLESQGELF